jgi:hypothetical protein
LEYLQQDPFITSLTSNQIGALAAINLALGIAYWLMHERDERLNDSESD